jgi:hypothetical protein
MAKHLFSEINFGEAEAELDHSALRDSFYESTGWTEVNSMLDLPFVVGRKGAGKSATAIRLGMMAKENGTPVMSLVPSDFRHVELRTLLSDLVETDAKWQYIYHEVWEGLILGQVVKALGDESNRDLFYSLSHSAKEALDEFAAHCPFYVNAVDEALIEVLVQYVRERETETNGVELVQLRKLVAPYKWKKLISLLSKEFDGNSELPRVLLLVDGLDEHWDSSEPSLYFLSQAVEVIKSLSGRLRAVVRFAVCIRDNIFRALVNTGYIEYDKLEGKLVTLSWDSVSLFALIARRAFPYKTEERAVLELREMLPESVDGVSTQDYLGINILNRPRDYINVFNMLRAQCADALRATESQVRDVIGQYGANRVLDLENEFAHTYPKISEIVSRLSSVVPALFSQKQLFEGLQRICADSEVRKRATQLLYYYGTPDTLAVILMSLGVIGVYDTEEKAIRCVQEFSQKRVAAQLARANRLGLHPVYRCGISRDVAEEDSALSVVVNPSDYLPQMDHASDLEPIAEVSQRRRKELLDEIGTIKPGHEHYARFERWVAGAITVSFFSDLVDCRSQVNAEIAGKRFEILFDIVGEEPPWNEIKSKYGVHRLLVECKNTDTPSDADFNKLERDMDSLDLNVVVLAYRSTKREPQGDVVRQIRSRYASSGKTHVILCVTETFLTQCLTKGGEQKARENLKKLWRLHVEQYLPH